MSPSVVDLAARLARRLPAEDLERLAAAAAGGPDGLLALRAASASTVVRHACARLLAELTTSPPAYLAGALAGAAAAARTETPRIDVVWTGPHSGVTTGRLTSAVVVDLIGAAAREVLLVSFAAHPEWSIAAALQDAVERGVEVTLLLERSADNPAYTGSDQPFAALAARRLAWPAVNRPDGAALHAKLIVVDAEVALVGSANLTGHALDRNLECSVLLRGGDAPSSIRRHLFDLHDRGILVATSDAHEASGW